MELLYYRR